MLFTERERGGERDSVHVNVLFTSKSSNAMCVGVCKTSVSVCVNVLVVRV